MIPVPQARPQTFRPVFAQPRPFATIAISFAALDEGYQFAATGEGRSWCGRTTAHNIETATLDAIAQIRAGLGNDDRMRFVIDLPSRSQLWRYATWIADAIPGAWVDHPDRSDSPLITAAKAAATQALTEPGSPVREPAIVATDGSVRRGYAGFGWLAASGEHGLGRYRSGKKQVGSMPVLVAELRAIGAAFIAHPGRHVTVLSDCRHAIMMANRWKRGEWVMPVGYPADHPDSERILAVVARHISTERNRIDVRWVRGHSGEPLNEGADALARLGCRHARTDPELDPDEFHRRAAGLAKAFSAEYRRLNQAPDQERMTMPR